MEYFKSLQKLCELAPDECMIRLGDIHLCMTEVAITTNDVASALSHANKSLEIFDRHDRNGWRYP